MTGGLVIPIGAKGSGGRSLVIMGRDIFIQDGRGMAEVSGLKVRRIVLTHGGGPAGRRRKVD